MGYKSVIKSMSAASRAMQAEQDRENRRSAREDERIRKKVLKIGDKQESIINALKDLLAKGKISQDRYDELKSRENDIPIYLISIGKTPGVNLAKRYITGKINEKEFESLQKEILPEKIFKEINEIESRLDGKKKELKNLIGKIDRKGDSDYCQLCNKKKSLFSRLYSFYDFILCKGCVDSIKEAKTLEAYDGKYFYTDPFQLDILGKNKKLMIILRQEWY